MRGLRTIVAALALLAGAASCWGNQRITVQCSYTGTVNTMGSASLNVVGIIYPYCQVAVYLTGTQTLATIYADTNNTPLANPFAANILGTGYFYPANGRYDVTISACMSPSPCTIPAMPGPLTIGDILASDTAGTGMVNIASLNGQTGASQQNKYDSWVTAQNTLAVNGILWTDPTQAAGNPSNSSAAPLGTYELFWNGNGQGCMDSLGGFLYNPNGMCFQKYETRSDSAAGTATNGAGASLVEFGYDSLRGGVYTAGTGSGGQKSNRQPIFIINSQQTQAQKWSIFEIFNGFSGGETIDEGLNSYYYGGWLSHGNIFNGSLFLQPRQGSLTDSNGGVNSVTNMQVTGAGPYTVSFTPGTNPQALSENRFMRDMGSGTAVTISGVANSGGNPNTVTLTRTDGNTVPRCATNPHSTYNVTVSNGELLTENMALDFTGNDGYDYVVPIVNCSSGTLTVQLQNYGTEGGTTWFGNFPTTFSATVYGGAYPTSVNPPASTFTTADASGITNGHAGSQVMAYNGAVWAIQVQESEHIGPAAKSGGINIQNVGTSTSPYMLAGVDVSGSFEAAYSIQSSNASSGQVLYGILAWGGNGVTSSFGSISAIADLNPGSIGTQKAWIYEDDNASQQNLFVYDRKHADAAAGLCILVTGLCVNPYGNSGAGSVGIGINAPGAAIPAFLQVGGTPNYPLSVGNYGIGVGIQAAALPANTAAYLNLVPGMTKGLEVVASTNMPNGNYLLEVADYNSGSPLAYFTVVTNGSGNAGVQFTNGALSSYYNTSAVLEGTVNAQTGAFNFASGTLGSPTGGNLGAGTLNMTGCFVNNVACLISGSIALASANVISWNSDTGISRGSAGAVYFGTGAAGNQAGSAFAAGVVVGSGGTNTVGLLGTTGLAIGTSHGLFFQSGTNYNGTTDTTFCRISAGAVGVASSTTCPTSIGTSGGKLYAANLTQQHSDYWNVQSALFATSTMLSAVYYEVNGGTLVGITARLSSTINCSVAPTVNILDLGTVATTAYGSGTSLGTLATGTSDGAYSSIGLSVAITAGHFIGVGFSAGTCVTAPTFDLTAMVQ